ncbi:hypothetical protein N7523_003586 [Penicillium sp. IBT 18751x]|nr:hypothetical protein N7523_003586 [Penicillium sp. IBT 18751x]
MVFIGTPYLPWERDVAAVVALPRFARSRTTTLERHTPTQVPTRAASSRVESTRTPAVLACSKSGVPKGTIMKQRSPDARDTGAARSSDEEFGDFVLHEVTVEGIRSDQR